MLARTAPALMAATRAHDAEIIYVLNGTTDQSADVIAQVFGENATILILEDASKTHALNAGDAHARHFPRFYLDADITLHPDALRILAEPLVKGDTDLTAAPILPISNGSWAARHVARIWGALPYTRLPNGSATLCRPKCRSQAALARGSVCGRAGYAGSGSLRPAGQNASPKASGSAQLYGACSGRQETGSVSHFLRASGGWRM